MADDGGLRKYADAVGYGPDQTADARLSLDKITAIEKTFKEAQSVANKEESANFASGAVRSADTANFDYTSMPLIGVMAVARTASEGATKYGRLNYVQGFPVHDLLNHAFHHLVQYTLGDRSQPHLEHAAWGLLAAIQQDTLDPELSKPHMLGPGATITPEVQKHLDDNKEQLAARRKAGEFDGIGDWKLTDLPEIRRLLEQRCK